MSVQTASAVCCSGRCQFSWVYFHLFFLYHLPVFFLRRAFLNDQYMICMYICNIHICIYVYVYIYIRVYTSIYWYIHIFVYIYICMHVYVRMYTYIGSVLAQFRPRFPSQIWVSDVTFVTFSGDKKCDASQLSHFWEECDNLAHENLFFNLWRFLSHPSRKTSHFRPRWYKTFFEREEMWRFGWDWNMFSSSRLRFVTFLGSVKREGHLG